MYYLGQFQLIFFALSPIILTIWLYDRVNSIVKSLVVYSALIGILAIIEGTFSTLFNAGLIFSYYLYLFKTAIIVASTFIAFNYYRSIPISSNAKYRRVISILGLPTALLVIPVSTFYAIYLLVSDYGRCFFFCRSYEISTPISNFIAPYIIVIFLALYIYLVVYKISKNSIMGKIVQNSVYLAQFLVFIPIIYIILYERWQKYRKHWQGSHPFDYVELNSIIVMGVFTLLCYFIVNIILPKDNTNSLLANRFSLLLFPVSIFILIIMIMFGYKPAGGIYTG